MIIPADHWPVSQVVKHAYENHHNKLWDTAARENSRLGEGRDENGIEASLVKEAEEKKALDRAR